MSPRSIKLANWPCKDHVKCSVDVWQISVKIRFNLLGVWQPVCRGTLQFRNHNFIFLQKRRLNLNWNTFWSNLSKDNTWMDYVRCQTGKTNVVLEYLGKIWTRICRNVSKTVPDRKPPVLLGTILWLYNMANPNIKAIWETDILASWVYIFVCDSRLSHCHTTLERGSRVIFLYLKTARHVAGWLYNLLSVLLDNVLRYACKFFTFRCWLATPEAIFCRLLNWKRGNFQDVSPHVHMFFCCTKKVFC